MEKMQINILQHLADGKKQTELPKLVNLSPSVVAIHMRMIRAELKAKHTVHALAIAMRNGLVR